MIDVDQAGWEVDQNRMRKEDILLFSLAKTFNQLRASKRPPPKDHPGTRCIGLR